MSAPTTTQRSDLTQLAQIVAVTNGVKTRTETALTKAYHQIQKPAPFTGISRTYRPRDDEGEQLPPESTLVQSRVEDLIGDVTTSVGRMLDVVATQEWANTAARGTITVDGVTLLADVPVTYLMWLEKQIIQLRTFISRLPTLDIGEQWEYDDDAQAYATPATETTRTKKVPRNHVKAEATDKHAAQVEVYHEDVVVGYWRTVKFSGAIPAAHVTIMAGRVDRLLDGIRFAREQANSIPVTDVRVADRVLAFLFTGASAT